MSSLSRLKDKLIQSASREFTNREDAVQTYHRSYDEYVSNPTMLRVITFYGIDGIGKTSLLRHLYSDTGQRLKKESGISAKLVWLSLDGLSYRSAAEFLFKVRSALQVPCPVFDYAMIKVWSDEGLSVSELKQRFGKDQSLAGNFLQDLSYVVDTIVPGRMLQQLYEYLQQKVERLFGRYREILARIDEMPVEQVRRNLPLFLGIAVDDFLQQSDRRLILFLDGFEVVDRLLKDSLAPASPDYWMQELIGAAERGLFVIANDNYLDWAAQNPNWENVLDQHLLGALSREDTMRFLDTVPVNEPGIREAIAERSLGIPLYLDLSIAIYLSRKASGERVEPSDFDTAQELIFARFFRALDMEFAETLKAVSLFDFFDKNIFAYIVKELNINFPVTLFSEFIKIAFIFSIDDNGGVYRVHEKLAAYVRNTSDTYTLVRAFRAFLMATKSRMVIENVEEIERCLKEMASFLSRHPQVLREVDAIEFLGIGDWLVTMGRWVAVGEVLEVIDPLKRRLGGREKLILKYLGGLCYRRYGELEKADEIFDQIAPQYRTLEKHAGDFLFHSAHVKHLLGSYDFAEERYKLCSAMFRDIPDADEKYIRCQRQYADICFLRGRFRTALDLLEELQRERFMNDVWIAETQRIAGHVYRFNMQLDKAESLYERTLKVAEKYKIEGLAGKALTNLAETLCWFSPSRGLSYADASIKLNADLIAPIEVGKALAAKAICLASMPEKIEQGRPLAEKAYELQSRVGYKSGCLFALHAQSLLAIVQRDKPKVLELERRMKELMGQIGVYRYLMLPVAVWLGRKGEERAVQKNAEWLNFNVTRDMLTCFMRLNKAID